MSMCLPTKSKHLSIHRYEEWQQYDHWPVNLNLTLNHEATNKQPQKLSFTHFIFYPLKGFIFYIFPDPVRVSMVEGHKALQGNSVGDFGLKLD